MPHWSLRHIRRPLLQGLMDIRKMQVGAVFVMAPTMEQFDQFVKMWRTELSKFRPRRLNGKIQIHGLDNGHLIVLPGCDGIKDLEEAYAFWDERQIGPIYYDPQ